MLVAWVFLVWLAGVVAQPTPAPTDQCSMDTQCPSHPDTKCNVSSCVNNACSAFAPKECADTNPCTIDTCHAATGICLHTTNYSCCQTNASWAHCYNPGGACTSVTCVANDENTTVGACGLVTNLTDCCETDVDCTGGDYCSAAYCDHITDRCANVNVSRTCPDLLGDPCMVPVCTGGACTYEYASNENKCPGACCFGNSTCAYEDFFNCSEHGGTWHGSTTNCSALECAFCSTRTPIADEFSLGEAFSGTAPTSTCVVGSCVAGACVGSALPCLVDDDCCATTWTGGAAAGEPIECTTAACPALTCPTMPSAVSRLCHKQCRPTGVGAEQRCMQPGDDTYVPSGALCANDADCAECVCETRSIQGAFIVGCVEPTPAPTFEPTLEPTPGADARADTGTNARTDARANERANARANASADAGANENANVSTDAVSNTETNAGADENADAISDKGADPITDTSANANANNSAKLCWRITGSIGSKLRLLWSDGNATN